MINDFHGEYHFLSNFYPVEVTYEGITYRNSEAAFQAAKILEGRERFANLSPSKAKALGRQVQLRPDWEQIKFTVMEDVCRAKFLQNPDIREKLLNTGDEYLEEGNFHNDKIWGTVNGIGENHLGRILMKLREEFRNGEV